MVQAIQIGGALAILGAFALLQSGVLANRGATYLGLNLAGSITLATTALIEEQWGFLMLNVAWALVSAWSIVRRTVRAT